MKFFEIPKNFLTKLTTNRYYESANATGHDVFVLPPSGHLYSYPAMMHEDVVQVIFN